MRLGECSIEVEGLDLSGLANESGGHRIQRVPPTERKGRVQTSTVTVAVIDATEVEATTITESDLNIDWYSGTGSGGQNRNKVKCSCRLTHIPTGIVKTAQTRSRTSSYALAYTQLITAIHELSQQTANNSIAANRKQQVGSGERGDKIRTIRFKDNSVIDHRTDKKCTAIDYLDGNMNKLWS